MFRLFRHVSLPYLRTSWGRTALVVGGVATGVSLIVAINVINASVLGNFRRTIKLIAGPAQLEVLLGIGEVGFEDSTLEIVRADTDVALAVPLVRSTIALIDDPTDTMQLFGADLTSEVDLQRYQISTLDRQEVLRGLEDPRSILLTSEFALAHGLAVRDAIRVSTPSGIRELTVRGLLDTVGLASSLGGRLAVMDLPAAQQLLGKEARLDQIDIVLRPGTATATVQPRLQRALGPALRVVRPEQRGLEYERVVSAFQAMLTGLSALCLVAGIFIIYNTTSTAAVRRATVMGELQFIGASREVLFRLLMLEALGLGGLGALAGLGTGLLLAQLLTGMVSDSMGVIFQLHFPVERLHAEARELFAIWILGTATTLFASSFAARRAARVEPLELIRKGPSQVMSPVRTTRLVFVWLAMIGLAVTGLILQKELKSFWWGNFGSTVWNASVVVIAVPIVGWCASILSRALPRLFGPEGRFAAESLIRSRTRTGVTVAAVALVLVIAVTITTLAVSFRKSVGSYMGAEGFLQGDLVVSAITTDGGWLETPLPDSVGTTLRGLPGVRDVQAWRAMFGQVYRGDRIVVFALDDGFLTPQRFRQRWYRDGDATQAAEALRSERGVSISTTAADRFDLHIGDTIDLDTPTGRVSFPIVGVVRDYISDRGSVVLSRKTLRARWQQSNASRFHVFLEPGTSKDEIRKEIRNALGGQFPLKILSLQEVVTYQTGAIDRAFAFTDAIQLLIVIITVAGIFDLLLAAIVERRRELALWRVIGADERTVRRSITIESGTIGVLGVILGLAVGVVTSWIWINLNFPYLLGFQLDLYFPLLSVSWYVVLVMGLTVLTGYIAARRATNEPIVDAIRPE